MVDSRQKGARAEAALKKVLRDSTGLNFQRTPGSGALDPTHMLKGDIYIPNEKNRFCIEVKHYKDDHFTSKIITDKESQLIKWWQQAIRQGEQVNMLPLLCFKKDRGKWFVATTLILDESLRSVDINYGEIQFTILLLDDLLKDEITWTL